MTSFENIVFDLGGVLLPLDFNKTARAFTALGVKNFDTFFTQYHAHPLFKSLETSEVVNQNFYDALRESAQITASNKEIDKAWNAMLLDFPKERIGLLQTLSQNHRLFLFSNTNAIHHAAFQENFLENFGFPLDTLFKKAYYSHQIGHRKPEIEAFEFIIEDGRLNKNKTLFIDDTLPNIEAAALAGLHTQLVSPNYTVMDFFNR